MTTRSGNGYARRWRARLAMADVVGAVRLATTSKRVGPAMIGLPRAGS